MGSDGFTHIGVDPGLGPTSPGSHRSLSASPEEEALSGEGLSRGEWDGTKAMAAVGGYLFIFGQEATPTPSPLRLVITIPHGS